MLSTGAKEIRKQPKELRYMRACTCRLQELELFRYSRKRYARQDQNDLTLRIRIPDGVPEGGLYGSWASTAADS